MTAACSEALPLIASRLSPLSEYNSRTGHERKLPVTWGLGGGFLLAFRFPTAQKVKLHKRAVTEGL